jgi:hypothetical protein
VLDSLTHMSAGLCECVCGNDCGGGGCLELSICDYVSECLDGRRTDGGGGPEDGGGGKCIPIKEFFTP